MKRRGNSASAAEPPRGVVAADVDDRELSSEARRRAAQKASSEAAGRPAAAPAAQPLPLGLIAAAMAVVGLMLYLTVKFS